MRSLPGVTVVSPCDDWEAAEATEAIATRPGTCYLRLDRCGAQTDRATNEKFELGQPRTLREGRDITLAATGGIMGEVLHAADELARRGTDCRVLSVHTLKPLDCTPLCRAALETGGLVTVEEHTVDGGLGGAVAEILLETGHAPKIFHRIGLRDGFSSIVGSQQYLRTRYNMNSAAIVETVTSLLGSAAPRRRPARAHIAAA
jgi:transketolase